MLNLLYRKILLIICAIVISFDSIILIKKLKKHPRPRALVNRCLHRGALRILKILKVKSSISLAAPLDFKPNENYIFMSNHQSLVDLPIIFANLPMSIRMVVKKELTRLPLFGHAVQNSEFLLIDRSNPAENLQFFTEAKKTMDSGIRLWIFPEGTRTRNGELLPFKLGGFRLARELGAKIVPVAIVGTYQVLPANTYDLTLHRSVELRIGQSIDTAVYRDSMMQKQLMDDVKDAISTLLKGPSLPTINETHYETNDSISRPL